MTELSFLIDLLLNHKLPREVKNLLAARIALIQNQATPTNNSVTTWRTGQASPQTAIGVVNTAAPPSARIVGGEVDTGGGTRGPRKF